MSEPLSIALLSHLASPRAPTGAERSLALLAGGLRRRGHRVDVVAPGAWALAGMLREADVPVSVVPTRPCWMTYYEARPWPIAAAKWVRCVGLPRGGRRLTRYLTRLAPDVVHVNCLPHLVGAEAANAAGRPVVWHLREILPPGRRRRWLAARLRKSATRVVAVSEAVAAWVREEGLGDRLQVVHNGVEAPVSTADAAAARRSLGLPGDGLLVGLFGQMVEHKGALAFVEAARRALGREPGLRFLLAGDGPRSFIERVENAIVDTGREDRFHLLPPQPSGESLVAASDVVCLATTTPDPFPRAVLEAMAAGRPVAAFDSGGTGEMVQSGRTGWIVPVGDVDALGEAFVRLAGDSEARRSMGLAGAKRTREQFSLERHIDRMEQLFRSVAR